MPRTNYIRSTTSDTLPFRPANTPKATPVPKEAMSIYDRLGSVGGAGSSSRRILALLATIAVAAAIALWYVDYM